MVTLTLRAMTWASWLIPKRLLLGWWVGGLSRHIFQIVENGDFFLVVDNENEVVVIAQVLHLGVHGGIVSPCFKVFLHVAVADAL
jgi:hypothetical protein